VDFSAEIGDDTVTDLLSETLVCRAGSTSRTERHSRRIGSNGGFQLTYRRRKIAFLASCEFASSNRGSVALMGRVRPPSGDMFADVVQGDLLDWRIGGGQLVRRLAGLLLSLIKQEAWRSESFTSSNGLV